MVVPFFSVGVSVLGGNTLPPSRVPVFGSSLGAVMLLGVCGLCSTLSMVMQTLGDSHIPARRSRRTHARAVRHMSSSWLHSLPSMVIEGLG